MTKAEEEPEPPEELGEPVGWIDIVLDIPVIDVNSAIKAIAEAIKVDPSQIVINQRGVCQSI